MADSIYKKHQLTIGAGIELEEIEEKRILSIAEKAGDLLSKGLVKEASASFDEIGKILNKKLVDLGKEPLVFTNIKIDNNTLDNMISTFADRMSSGVANSIETGFKKGFEKVSIGQIDLGVDEELKKLKADRKKLVAEYKKIVKENPTTEVNKAIKGKASLTLTGDLATHTEGYIKKFNDASNKMQVATQGTQEYTDAVYEAQEALDNLRLLQDEFIKKREDLAKKKKEADKLFYSKPSKNPEEKAARDVKQKELRSCHSRRSSDRENVA